MKASKRHGACFLLAVLLVIPLVLPTASFALGDVPEIPPQDEITEVIETSAAETQEENPLQSAFLGTVSLDEPTLKTQQVSPMQGSVMDRFDYDGLNYQINSVIPENENTVFAMGWDDESGPKSTLKIPATAYDGSGTEYKVIGIYPYAFSNNADLTTLDLTEAVYLNSISEHAFSATGLTGELYLPPSLANIGSGAFAGTALTGPQEFPLSLTSIGSGAFVGMVFNGPLTLPPYIQYIDSGAFESAFITGRLVIPESVEVIGPRAFANTEITSVDLRSFTGELLPEAFTQCKNLTQIIFGQKEAAEYDSFIFAGLPEDGRVCYPRGASGYSPGTFAEGTLKEWDFRAYTSFTATQVGGISGIANTTSIEVTFSDSIPSYQSHHAILANGSGSAVRGNFGGTGTVWTLEITQVNAEGYVYLTLEDSDPYTFVDYDVPVMIYKQAASPPVAPEAPQNLKAVRDKSTITLSWDPPTSDGGSQITGYTLYRNGTLVATLESNYIGYYDHFLLSGVQYTYELYAHNYVGQSDAARFVVMPTGPIVWPVVKTGDATINPNDGKDATFTIEDAELSEVSGFTLNGQEMLLDDSVDGVLSFEGGTLTEGSVIVTLNNAFLKTLANGTYTFEVAFLDDSTALANFSVSWKTLGNANNPNANPPANSLPTTGDTAPYTLVLSFLAFSLGTFGMSIVARRRELEEGC